MQKTRERRNESELECERDLEALGLVASKRGWPDFLAWNPDGTLAFVAEVKKRPDSVLKLDQIRVMAALQRSGIVVARYDPVSGFSKFREGAALEEREVKLLRLALDPGASDGESKSAACRWIESLRRSKTSADEIVRKLDSLSDEPRTIVKTVRVEVPAKKEWWETRVMPFGKWKDYRLREIVDRAPGYLVWLRDKADLHDEILKEDVQGALDWLGL